MPRTRYEDSFSGRRRAPIPFNPVPFSPNPGLRPCRAHMRRARGAAYPVSFCSAALSRQRRRSEIASLRGLRRFGRCAACSWGLGRRTSQGSQTCASYSDRQKRPARVCRSAARAQERVRGSVLLKGATSLRSMREDGFSPCRRNCSSHLPQFPAMAGELQNGQAMFRRPKSVCRHCSRRRFSSVQAGLFPRASADGVPPARTLRTTLQGASRAKTNGEKDFRALLPVCKDVCD